ncbi:MAG: ATP-dependent helicase [FCB group bacterium]|nr:ATP-dependent helicase [FCB group bacterium]
MMKIKLNDDQRKAVTSPVEKAVKISAGAGTGKTTVLTERFLYLLKRGYKLNSILALTFTRKAAAEMRARIFQYLKQPRDILDTHIYNFDSFFLTILCMNPLETGIDRSIKVLDGTEFEKFRGEIRRKALNSVNLPALSPGDTDRLSQQALKVVMEARQYLIDLNSFLNITTADIESKPLLDTAQAVYAELDRKLKETNALDFSEISLRCYDLLKNNSSLRNALKRHYRYILLDEVQDTNPAQFALLSLIADDNFANVTAVGDDKQSIYRFRGAEIGNLRNFPGTDYHLRQNFRSPQNILELAHRLICQDRYFDERSEDIKLYSEEERKIIPEIIFHRAEDSESCSVFTAHEIADMIDKGTAPDDIAVLSRSRAPLKSLEIALTRNNIRFHTIGGGYFDREEIKDIYALIKFIVFPNDKGALTRLMMRPPYNFTFDKIADILKNGTDRLSYSPETAALFNFREKIISHPQSLVDTLIHILTLSQYYRITAASNDPERSIANTEKMMKMAQDFAGDNPAGTMEDFLQYIESYLEYDKGESEAETAYSGAVTLSTIHAAKGLEWPVVFYFDVKEGTDKRTSYQYIFDPVKLELTAAKNPANDEKNSGFEEKLRQSKKKENEIAEEIRLQYVAVTRAKDRIYLLSHKGFPFALQNPEELLESCAFEFRDSIPPARTVNQTVIDYYKALDDIGSALTGLKPMPKPVDNEPIKLNFSALKDYLKCPRYYYFKHHLKLGELPDREQAGETYIDYLLIGSLTHKILAADPNLKQDWRDTLRRIYQPIGALPELNEASTEEIDGLMRNYREMNLHENEVFWREKPFKLAFDLNGRTLFFSGIIDRMEKIDGGLYITDIKTGKTIGEDLRREFQLQLSSYLLAVKEGALSVENEPLLAIISLSEKRVIPIEYDPEIKNIILAATSAVSKGEFPLREGSACERCCFYDRICNED